MVDCFQSWETDKPVLWREREMGKRVVGISLDRLQQMAIDSALDKSGSEDVRQLMCNEKPSEMNMQEVRSV